ncbi:thioredoxin family protein [Candidatus Marinamargulisbacteria bacterium SCGC AAA071-K20]|nr:thioredoxin family protein [Candidatus Marinamargulisbacteria bacterium SCGC AAA071-K20]
MTLVESRNLELGQKMPPFNLLDPMGKSHDINKEMGAAGIIILFTCNHCPYAIAIWKRIIDLSKEAASIGINTVAINPNINPNYPDDSPENMQKKGENLGISFPYLVDKNQAIAKSYNAVCTPDLYLLNNKKELMYHGRLDDNWQNESAVQKQDLKDAVIALANKQTIEQKQVPSMGCSIKWV